MRCSAPRHCLVCKFQLLLGSIANTADHSIIIVIIIGIRDQTSKSKKKKKRTIGFFLSSHCSRRWAGARALTNPGRSRPITPNRSPPLGLAGPGPLIGSSVAFSLIGYCKLLGRLLQVPLKNSSIDSMYIYVVRVPR
jgi:hypothetical protein